MAAYKSSAPIQCLVDLETCLLLGVREVGRVKPKLTFFLISFLGQGLKYRKR